MTCIHPGLPHVSGEAMHETKEWVWVNWRSVVPTAWKKTPIVYIIVIIGQKKLRRKNLRTSRKSLFTPHTCPLGSSRPSTHSRALASDFDIMRFQIVDILSTMVPVEMRKILKHHQKPCSGSFAFISRVCLSGPTTMYSLEMYVELLSIIFVRTRSSDLSVRLWCHSFQTPVGSAGIAKFLLLQ